MENKIQKIGVTNKIWYEFPNSNVKMFCVFIEEDKGMSHKLIKWSIDVGGDIDQYYMIDSINPIRVLGGIAPFSEVVHTILWETEEEVLKFVENLDLEKLKELMSKSIFISYRDKAQMSVPPCGEIKLYEPTQEEIEFKNKLIKSFNEILSR